MKINGEKLKALRKSLNITQLKLAKKCGFLRATYANWETGSRSPSLEDLLKVANALHIDLKKLIDAGVIANDAIPDNMRLETILKKLPEEFVRFMKFYETLPDETKRKAAREAMDEAVKRAIDKM